MVCSGSFRNGAIKHDLLQIDPYNCPKFVEVIFIGLVHLLPCHLLTELLTKFGVTTLPQPP